MGPVQLKLLHVADNLQNAEKDAMGRLKELMKSSNWELGQRLDQQMSVNAQLGGQLQSSWEKILAVVNRLEVTTNSLENRMQESETKVNTWCTKVTDSLEGIFSNIAGESKNIQEQCNRQFDAVQDTLARQEARSQRDLQSSCEALADRVDKVAAKSKEQTAEVKEGQSRIQGSVEAVSREILGLQVQDEHNHAALKCSMDEQTSTHKHQLFELKTEMEALFEPVSQDCSEIRKKSEKATKTVLYEVARIQKELRVDYVKLKNYLQEATTADDFDGKDSLRCRDYFSQTDSASLKDNSIQTDPVQFDNGQQKKPKKKKEPTKQEDAKSKINKAAFSGADQLKAQATAAAMKKQYNVFDYYHETGWIQLIAKNKWFENITLFVITVNALYLSVDTDLNNSSTIVDATPIFQFAEITFFSYFISELTVRFLAFKIKKNCLTDRWFIFDSFLVFIMTCETVILPIILLATDSEGGLPGGTSALRMLRLLRLLRLTRLTKILRALPELVIIMKGVAFAARSVTIFFVLWTMIAYVFAILFRNLPGDIENTPAVKKYFPSVTEAMNNMLLYGIFQSNALVVKEIIGDVPWMWPFLVFFFALVSLTIMYMLVGVLVDVISVVATTEKEKLGMTYIVELLRDELEKLGLKEDLKINQAEFQNLILEPGIIRVLQEAGVDVAVLADMLDVVFEDVAHKGEEGKGSMMTFSDLVNLLLSMRGANPATVKDCKEQIRVTKTIIRQCMDDLADDLNDKFSKLRNDLQNLDSVEDDDD
eukprot:TRINITY_DN27325_c0_g2_i1.p1 TRINITY_DN27325_c0_g2~~TRINITY_DN27325_c0_g2_i1.p1  ORF type:complete len:890 (+),score=186.88 TRINITY_DN27325_c0_g2_i1:374-2671(+)